MTWYEYRLSRGIEPSAFYARIEDPDEIVSHHHFFDEPWHPGAYVVRVKCSASMAREIGLAATAAGALDEYEEWDSKPDEELFGNSWLAVSNYLQASSDLMMFSRFRDDPWYIAKLTHCLLNAQGYTWRDEVRFHRKQAYRRAKLIVKSAFGMKLE